ncbi:uncharacterized protein PAC_02745 [Phialocephala subalpina]|uniref:Nucleoside phosphorylase domain-containing protein n=1 Tax=Phialocephala subalpina TaxID=576137 RepID=A0A1L7WJE7_9HELO|nr:uncharacterized protein PAC_02745 [Phialocephala subalpina]
MPPKSLHISEYTVGWLCAIEEECYAASGMLDFRHSDPYPAPTDQNDYMYGEICSHNVVIVKLPTGHTGKAGASRTAVLFSESFPTIKIYLFVGIGGGMPWNSFENKPIHLGDVVVASPTRTGLPAIVYIIDQPITQLVIAVDRVARRYNLGDSPFHDHLKLLSPENLARQGVKYNLDKFNRPDSKYDILFGPKSKHHNGDDCSGCARSDIARQSPPSDRNPEFHRGPIASGDSVIQSGEERDRLSEKYKGAICFEMEAAGVMFETHCLVIRGISDYADAHKGYKWHNYAAATAAAFARQLLYDMPTTKKLEAKRLSAQPVTARASSSLRTPLPIAEAPDSGLINDPEEVPASSAQLSNSANTTGVSAPVVAWPLAPPTPPEGQKLPRLYKRDDKY